MKKFRRATVKAGDQIITTLTHEIPQEVIFTEVNWVAVKHMVNNGETPAGWRRVPYNKIVRNLTTELSDTIDELVNLD